MSEIRVDKIESPTGTVTFLGITTFSGSGSFTIPGGTEEQRPSSPVAAEIRVIQGEIGSAIERYDGTSWDTI